MRTLFFALLSLGQIGPATYMSRDLGRIGVQSTLRSDPPSADLTRKFTIVTPRVHSSPSSPMFFSRILLDTANHRYFGYELFIEQQQPGVYLATVGKLGVTPLDLAANGDLKFSMNGDGLTNLAWTLLAAPETPKPRLIHDGDALSIDIFSDNGAKLIDDIRITAPAPARIATPIYRTSIGGFTGIPRAPAQVPPVSGPARDFSSADAELQLVMPRGIFLNGIQLGSIALRDIRGPLVWLYLPDHGRYIFSLASRSDLGFIKAGEVRGGLIVFKLGDDSVTFECAAHIAPGNSAYYLYVLHDPDWEPVSPPQTVRPGAGSVSADELAALKKK